MGLLRPQNRLADDVLPMFFEWLYNSYHGEQRPDVEPAITGGTPAECDLKKKKKETVRSTLGLLRPQNRLADDV